MTRSMSWLGTMGMLLIVAGFAMAMLREPAQQLAAAENIRSAAIVEGIDLYVGNCVACHGASGEGLAAYPVLNNEGIRNMETELLYHTVERGRYNTAMVAYSVNEGGILTQAQISSLVTMIQFGAWEDVSARAIELGLMPPQMTSVEIPEDTLVTVRALPSGDQLASGLTIYAENCAACHGANGEGTTIAPMLYSAELRSRLTDADVTRIIQQGVPGTVMASWERALNEQQITDVVTLIRQWDEITASGIQLPTIQAQPIDQSPATIAAGQQLFNLVCSQCHGTDGYGTKLAPALNNLTFLSQTPDEAIYQIIALGVTGTAMPSWSGYLTNADISAIVAYLRSLEPSAPAVANPGIGKP
jgi:mono/diheme cytochrome c family protein